MPWECLSGFSDFMVQLFQMSGLWKWKTDNLPSTQVLHQLVFIKCLFYTSNTILSSSPNGAGVIQGLVFSPHFNSWVKHLSASCGNLVSREILSGSGFILQILQVWQAVPGRSPVLLLSALAMSAPPPSEKGLYFCLQLLSCDSQHS